MLIKSYVQPLLLVPGPLRARAVDAPLAALLAALVALRRRSLTLGIL